VIDLHSHTTESDGTLTPRELIAAAVAAHLEALAITDHDTFAGYDAAVRLAAAARIELICGIELSVKWRGQTVHLLGYFLDGAPHGFRTWVLQALEAREERNRRLEQSLNDHGIAITLEEVHRLAGPLAGRPHFAALMIQKGYAANTQEAFDKYLGEHAPCYVPRDEPAFVEAVGQIARHGGISSLAHPGRTFANRDTFEEHVREMRGNGLHAIEVWHSDHSDEDSRFYEALAGRYGLRVTGGSDFHGANKPSIALGTGRDGRLNVPRSVLDRLRASASWPSAL